MRLYKYLPKKLLAKPRMQFFDWSRQAPIRSHKFCIENPLRPLFLSYSTNHGTFHSLFPDAPAPHQRTMPSAFYWEGKGLYTNRILVFQLDSIFPIDMLGKIWLISGIWINIGTGSLCKKPKIASAWSIYRRFIFPNIQFGAFSREVFFPICWTMALFIS